jgi:hypothetical protein
VNDAVTRAYAAYDAEDWGLAGALLREAIAAAESDGVTDESPEGRELLAGWWFDVALTHKFRRDWPGARDAGRRAAELASDGPQQPAWWNLGIAATALHDWPLAREAWTRYGVDLPPGDGAPDGDLGQTPVRISTAAGPEVVWCRRIDPARARVLNVPLPGSGRRYGEVVLHDGVPNGSRVVAGHEWPVFDEIELWAESDVPVQAVRLRLADESDLRALIELGDGTGVPVESWESVVMVCRECSEGSLDQSGPPGHEHGSDTFGRLRVGVAAPRDTAERLLAAWVAAEPARRGAGEPETVA